MVEDISYAPARKAFAPDAADTLVDALGRTLSLREIEALEEQDLIALVGDPLCLNRLYMARVFAVASVAAIDGDPLPLPLTEAELKSSFKRVRRAGLDALLRRAYEGAGKR